MKNYLLINRALAAEKKLLSLFTALLFVGNMWGAATTIASWGKVSIAANTAIVASGGAQSGVAQFTSDKAMTTAGGNSSKCYYGSSAGGATIIFSNIDLSNYTDVTMTFYSRASQSGSMQISYSSDGTNYTNLNAPSLSGTEGQKTSNTIPNTATYIKLAHSKSSGSLYFGTIEIKGTEASKKNTTLALSPTSLNLLYGGSTGSLTATVTPEGESALVSPTITWTSDDESVATVSNSGVVSPVGEGSCTITASYAGDNTYKASSNTATVTVSDTRTAVVSAITKINSIKGLYIGGKHAFSPVVTLADGLSESDVTYSYVSADPTTIQINDDGTYTALKTGTDIDITVTVTPIAEKVSTHKPVSATFQHNGAYKYKAPVFTPTGLIDETTNFNGSMTLEMANNGTPTGPIYYTLNGEEPAEDRSNCTLYESELTFTATKTVKARVIDENGYYSTVTSATYTKVPANKDAISLDVNESLSFTDFSDAGSYWSSESKYIISSDGDKYKWTGTDVGNYSGKTLQIKNNTSAYITSCNVTSPNGFKMTVTNTGSVYVYVGETKQTAEADGAYYFPTNTAVTLKRGTSSTPQVSNITFTGLKPSRSVTFEDGDQAMTYGGSTITKTATISPVGTATYASSNTAVATVNATTGEVTAVKGGTAVITATIAADEDYEQSKGSYTVTVNKAASTLAFANAEETVELVDGTATFTATIDPADGRSVTYSSSDITVNSSTGVVTLTETGDFVIKANAAANDRYLAPEEASYTLHVEDNRQPVVSNLNLVLTVGGNPIALNAVKKDDMGTLSATYTKAAGFDGTEVVTFESSDPIIFEIDEPDFAANKGGVINVTVTVTSNGNKMFTTVEKAFEVTITNTSKTTTEITVNDAEDFYVDGDALNLTYGTPFDLTVEATDGYEGTIAKALGIEQIAEISVTGSTYTITPLAVGSTTLKFSAAETANYAAAEDITLTINVASNVTAQTTTPKEEDAYYIAQHNLKSVHPGWSLDGENVWSFDNSYGAVAVTTKTSGTYDLVSPDFDCTRYTGIGIDFEHTGKTFSTPKDACKVYVQEGSNTPELLDPAYFLGSNWTWTESGDLELGEEYDGKTIHFIFRFIPTSGNGGKWEVRNFNIWGIPNPSEEVTLNEDGYATYCSQYPLDFSDYATADYKAYQAVSVSTTKITFQKITGEIKGGQGILLKGTPNATITLYNSFSSDAELSSNKLVGCMVPTYLAASPQDYVLNGDAFELVNSGETLGANKAYLHLTEPLEGTPASLTLEFEDTPTALDNTELDSKAVKVLRNGVLYIEKNGKTYNAQGQLVK